MRLPSPSAVICSCGGARAAGPKDHLGAVHHVEGRLVARAEQVMRCLLVQIDRASHMRADPGEGEDPLVTPVELTLALDFARVQADQEDRGLGLAGSDPRPPSGCAATRVPICMSLALNLLVGVLVHNSLLDGPSRVPQLLFRQWSKVAKQDRAGSQQPAERGEQAAADEEWPAADAGFLDALPERGRRLPRAWAQASAADAAAPRARQRSSSCAPSGTSPTPTTRAPRRS
jgi:hypothetical protein